ncbi:hypothetical protein [Clostridium tertium]|uniref:hypothetical protein n=1 Tax=Clostridium tertium TaxID=1559 RepID=UPI0023B300DF|nr:hypothetical protein [Clostridium tertium]
MREESFVKSENTNKVNMHAKNNQSLAELILTSKMNMNIQERQALKDKFESLLTLTSASTKLSQEDIDKQAMRSITTAAVNAIGRGDTAFSCFDANISREFPIERLDKGLETYGIAFTRTTNAIIFQVYSETTLFKLTGTAYDKLRTREVVLEEIVARLMNDAMFNIKHARAVELGLSTQYRVIDPYNGEVATIDTLLLTIDEIKQLLDTLNTKLKAKLVHNNKIVIEGISL